MRNLHSSGKQVPLMRKHLNRKSAVNSFNQWYWYRTKITLQNCGFMNVRYSVIELAIALWVTHDVSEWG